jgi:putative iron-regulated protein
LLKQWAPGKLGNFRAIFEEGYDQSIERLLTGMIFLSGNELAGERLQVAWDTKEQEDEHSCFSDMTHQDLIFDALGLQNIYRGQYVRLDGTTLSGPSLRQLAELVQPDLVPGLDAKIDGTLAAARAIPAPFDQAILGEDDAPGRLAVMKTITTAEDQSALLRRFARALQIQIPEQPAGDVAG